MTIQRAKICIFFYWLIDIAQWLGCFCLKHPTVPYCENSSGILGSTTTDFIKRRCLKKKLCSIKKKKDFIGFYGPLWGHWAWTYVKNTPAFSLNHKRSDETNDWNLSISLTWENAWPDLLHRFFHHIIWVRWVRITKIFIGNLWAVKFLNFKKFKHLSPAATWVCQNLMWLNAALTWQIDLKWKKFRDECLHHQHLFLSSHKYRISHFFPSFLILPPFFSVLSWWLVRLRGARVWKRPTEAWWGLS